MSDSPGQSSDPSPEQKKTNVQQHPTRQDDAHPPGYKQYLKLPTARGARRVTFEERLRQEQELASESEKEREDGEKDRDYGSY